MFGRLVLLCFGCVVLFCTIERPVREPSPEPVRRRREPSPEPVREPSPEPVREPSPEPEPEPQQEEVIESAEVQGSNHQQ